MTTFLRLLGDKNKQGALANAVQPGGSNYFEVDPISFRQIPGAPFAYWATEYIRNIFKKFPPYESESRLVRQGLSTADDFRFVRCWWEVPQEMPILETLRAGSDSYERTKWIPLLKGGGRSSFVSEINLVVNYGNDGRELKSWISGYVNSGWSKYIISTELYFQRGFSWALRSARFAPSAVPEGCIFSASRYEAFANKNDLPWIIGLLNSNVASFLLRMCSENFERPKYVVGIVSNLPLPNPEQQRKKELADLFYKATSIRRRNLRTCETSHCFLLPEYLQSHLSA